MSSTYKCDGCGKERPAAFYPSNPLNYHKPNDWFQRGDKDGIQDACSRECVDKIAQKSKKTGVILPL